MLIVLWLQYYLPTVSGANWGTGEEVFQSFLYVVKLESPALEWHRTN